MCNVAACDPVDGSCSVLTPVTCPPGYSCDPEVGCVEDEPEPECPCFSEADLQAQGGIYQCGEGYIAEGVINYFLNANYYCSGTEGCTQDNLGNPVTGCATLTDYDSDLGTWLNQSGMAISDAEDSACRAALLATCSAQSSLTSQAQSDGGPVDLPAATTVDP